MTVGLQRGDGFLTKGPAPPVKRLGIGPKSAGRLRERGDGGRLPRDVPRSPPSCEELAGGVGGVRPPARAVRRRDRPRPCRSGASAPRRAGMVAGPRLGAAFNPLAPEGVGAAAGWLSPSVRRSTWRGSARWSPCCPAPFRVDGRSFIDGDAGEGPRGRAHLAALVPGVVRSALGGRRGPEPGARRLDEAPLRPPGRRGAGRMRASRLGRRDIRHAGRAWRPVGTASSDKVPRWKATDAMASHRERDLAGTEP
jgi:hypothetical protein